MSSVVRRHAVGGVVVSERRYEPRCEQRRHQHERASMYLLLAGSCVESYGSRERAYRRSSIVTNPAGVTHAVRYHDQGGRILHVELDQGFDRVEETRGGRADALMRDLHRALVGAELGSSIDVEALACEVAAELARDGRAPERRVPAWLVRVRDRLHDDDGQPTSLSEIGENVGIHPTHLARTFRRYYGCTIGAYLRQVRVQEARDRLAESDEPLADVAIATGF